VARCAVLGGPRPAGGVFQQPGWTKKRVSSSHGRSGARGWKRWRASEEPRAGPWWEVGADQRRGIPDADLDHIYGRSSPGGPNGHARPKGSGLGGLAWPQRHFVDAALFTALIPAVRKRPARDKVG